MPDQERSLHHWSYNRGKRSVVLDLGNAADIERLKALIAGADVVFESFDPGEAEALGLGRDALAELNPALIHVSITPFGSDGPKANWAVSDLALQASAVNMAITGDKDRSPLRAGGTLPQAMHNAASEGAGAALIALWDRQTRSGLGQHVDMSAQQSMSQACMSSTLKHVAQRLRDKADRGRRQPAGDRHSAHVAVRRRPCLRDVPVRARIQRLHPEPHGMGARGRILRRGHSGQGTGPSTP